MNWGNLSHSKTYRADSAILVCACDDDDDGDCCTDIICWCCWVNDSRSVNRVCFKRPDRPDDRSLGIG